jgi:hypothetical protein
LHQRGGENGINISMRAEIPRKMYDSLSNLHLESLGMGGEFALQASPNLIGDLIVTECRAEPHFIDHGLGRHRARHLEYLSACRLCINLPSQDHDLRIIMHRDFIRSVLDLLLNRSTD